jgi:hypothetical protein
MTHLTGQYSGQDLTPVPSVRTVLYYYFYYDYCSPDMTQLTTIYSYKFP